MYLPPLSPQTWLNNPIDRSAYSLGTITSISNTNLIFPPKALKCSPWWEWREGGSELCWTPLHLFLTCLFESPWGRAQSPFQWVGPPKVLSGSALIFYSETEHRQWGGNGEGRTSRQVICQSGNNVHLVHTAYKWQLNSPSTDTHGALHTALPCRHSQDAKTSQMRIGKAVGTTKPTVGFCTSFPGCRQWSAHCSLACSLFCCLLWRPSF